MIFTNYTPGARLAQTFEVTNPGRSTRLVRVLPPARPFFLAEIQFRLAPGETKQIRVVFRPDGYGRAASDARVESGAFRARVALVGQNGLSSFRVRQVLVDGSEVPAV